MCFTTLRCVVGPAVWGLYHLSLNRDWILLSHFGPWNKRLNFIFPIKYAIPRSLKVSHWLSHLAWRPSNSFFVTTFPPRNSRPLIAGLIKWQWWLIVPKNKAGDFLGETWHWGSGPLRFPWFDWRHFGKHFPDETTFIHGNLRYPPPMLPPPRNKALIRPY